MGLPSFEFKKGSQKKVGTKKNREARIILINWNLASKDGEVSTKKPSYQRNSGLNCLNVTRKDIEKIQKNVWISLTTIHHDNCQVLFSGH